MDSSTRRISAARWLKTLVAGVSVSVLFPLGLVILSAGLPGRTASASVLRRSNRLSIPTAQAATLSSTESKAGFHQSLTVLSFTGSGGVGATNTVGATSGAPIISITTTKSGSLVYAVGEDWDQAIGRTVGTGQSLVSQWVDSSAGDTHWMQQLTNPVASPALVMLNDSAPTADRWDLAAIEVTGS